MQGWQLRIRDDKGPNENGWPEASEAVGSMAGPPCSQAYTWVGKTRASIPQVQAGSRTDVMLQVRKPAGRMKLS